MSRRREAERPGEKKARPEKKPPPGRFVRRGPHVLHDRHAPIWNIDLNNEEELKRFHEHMLLWNPVTQYNKMAHGELSPEEAADFARRYLDACRADLEDLVERAKKYEVDDPNFSKMLLNISSGVLGVLFAQRLLERLPPEASVAAAMAFSAGHDCGRLHEAELQAAEIFAGDKVRRGGTNGAEKRRKNSGTPPTEQRIAAWREELAKVRKPDRSLPRGAISRIARTLAKRFRTEVEAERRFYYDRLARGEL